MVMLRNILREIKWRWQRSKHQIPDCDIWNLDMTISYYIAEGLDKFIKKNEKEYSSGEYGSLCSDLHKSIKELKEVRDFFKKYNTEKYIFTSTDDMRDFQKRQDRAFRILSKHFLQLWD